jgi:hypothetical protein
VDTSTYGFVSQPFYFATLGGSVLWPNEAVGPLVSIVRATAAAFELHLRFGFTAGGVPLPVLRALADTATVSWVGVEPVVGCPPSLSLLNFIDLGATAFEISTKWSAALAALTRIGP